MIHKKVDEVIKTQFEFLKADFGFELSKSRKESWGYEFIYLNETTGVQLIHELREAYLYISLYKLDNGAFQENPKNITVDSTLFGYTFDDLVLLRNPKALIKPAYEYGVGSKYYDPESGLTLYISEFSSNMKEYASDLLQGNFDVFDQLDLIVKERVSKSRTSE